MNDGVELPFGANDIAMIGSVLSRVAAWDDIWDLLWEKMAEHEREEEGDNEFVTDANRAGARLHIASVALACNMALQHVRRMDMQDTLEEIDRLPTTPEKENDR